MNVADPPGIVRRPLLRIIALSLLTGSLMAAAPKAESTKGAEAGQDDIITLEAYNVQADMIEDFGFRVWVEATRSGKHPKSMAQMMVTKFTPRISAVLPNTAAARAGLQPGEFILKSEGKPTTGGMFSTGKFGAWPKTQKKKWAELAAGKAAVTWTLEVENPATGAVRTVRLTAPTPAPHWGAAKWTPPADRQTAVPVEAGPLADRAQYVLANGIFVMADSYGAEVFGEEIKPGHEPTGYEWHFGTEQLRRMFVTQFRGCTKICFETTSRATGRWVYLTSPTGELVRAWRVWGSSWQSKAFKGIVPIEEARAGFATELDFWTTKVVPGTGRWPLEVKAGYDAATAFPAAPGKSEGPPALAAEFLKLRAATASERALFDEAFGQLGAEAENWAYAETSRGIEDQRVLVTRVDPSRSGAERCVLVSINGKAPTAAEVQEWREVGGDLPKPLGELPSLREIFDFKDLRVLREEDGVVVFELPLRSDNGDFPRDKFQALVRVNTSTRALEEITVRLRESMRMAGVVKLSEAGLQVRFARPDPAHPPQPIYLRSGGTARILLVKITRAFEATRMDFRRVEPHPEPGQP